MASGAKSVTTPIPEFNMPNKMGSLHDIRELNSKMEEIVRIRRQQVEKGKTQKT